MNPFLVEPVYKRPKRKPAAKKKPAIKRKAPARKPAVRRRGGTKVVYVEDYTSPYDPIGLWSARAKDVLGPKVSGKVPVLTVSPEEEEEFHEVDGGEDVVNPGEGNMLGTNFAAVSSRLKALSNRFVGSQTNPKPSAPPMPADLTVRVPQGGGGGTPKTPGSGGKGSGEGKSPVADASPPAPKRQRSGGRTETPKATGSKGSGGTTAGTSKTNTNTGSGGGGSRRTTAEVDAVLDDTLAYAEMAPIAQIGGSGSRDKRTAPASPSHTKPADLALRGFNAVRSAKLDKHPSPKSREWLALTLTPEFVANVEKATKRPFATVTDPETAKKVIELNDANLLNAYMRGITNQKQHSGKKATSAAEAKFGGDKPPARLGEALDRALGPIAEDEALELGAQQRRATRKRKVTRPRR